MNEIEPMLPIVCLENNNLPYNLTYANGRIACLGRLPDDPSQLPTTRNDYAALLFELDQIWSNGQI